MKGIWTFLLAGLLLCGTADAQNEFLTVKGTVKDELQKPMAGVSVIVTGRNGGTVTDMEGKYALRAKKGETLSFNFIGYQTLQLVVDGPVMNVSLLPSDTQLEEVIVVGYSTPKSAVFTGTVSAVAEASPQVAGKQTLYSRVAHVAFAPYPGPYGRADREEYSSIRENRFFAVDKEPLSTFSLDVDGASYSNMRRMVNQGQMPQTDAVRTEELVNYFSYDYEKPSGSEPLKISYEVGACPWNRQHRLVRIGVKAREIASENMPASNLVFLIDVSGSMYGPTRLELVKSSLKLLVNNLREEDRVSIVVYAGAAGVALPATAGSDKQKIREALDNLTAGGSTAGGAGIKRAYEIARQNFMDGGNNRVILCTDGDFNVGVSSPQELEKLIEQERKSGVFLTVLGYGMGNYKDNRLQTLAEKGNGNYAYIDNIQEANRVLVHEFGGTIHTVAKDVKLQIEFNPEKVQAYRLIGYESRLLDHEDFNDDTKDAGEVGAGHSVTAFYEIIPVGVQASVVPAVDPLKYQTVEESSTVSSGTRALRRTNRYPDMMTIKLRYKDPDKDVSRKMEVAVIDRGADSAPSADFAFGASVAMFGQLLRDSDFKGTATYDDVIALAKQGWDHDAYGYRREFVRLAESVKGLAK